MKSFSFWRFRWIAFFLMFALATTYVGFHWQKNAAQTFVATWGNSGARQGVFRESSNGMNFLTEQNLPDLLTAVKTQPLILHDPKKGADGDQLFFGTETGELRWLGLQDLKLVSSLSLDNTYLASTPVALSSDEIWGLFVNSASEGPGERHYKLLRIKDGQKSCEVKFELDDWIKPLAATDPKASSTLHCVTALAFEPVTRKLVFGCSRNPRADANAYASSRGITGGLFTLDLKTGSTCPGTEDLKMFHTAEVGEMTEGGVDVGVWMTGAAVTVTGQGTVLFPTGNGLFDPKRHNYGCSLIHLDLRENPYKILGVRAHDENGSDECVAMNIDYASSGVALGVDKESGRPWYFLGGKDGVLKYGPLDRLGDQKTHFQQEFGEYHYGTPHVLEKPDGGFLVFVANQLIASNSMRDEVLASASDPGARCLGLVRAPEKKAAPEDLEIREYEAGEYRRDHVLVAESSKAEFEITHRRSKLSDSKISYRHLPGYFPSYRNFKTVGLEPQVQDLRLLPRSARLQRYYLSRGDSVVDLRLEKHAPRAQQKVGALLDALQVIEGVDCKKAPAGFHALYVKDVLTHEKTSASAQVHAFDIEPRGGISRRMWRWRNRDENWVFPNSSSALMADPLGGGKLALALWNPVLKISKLSLLDLSNGALLSEIPFAGPAHFTQGLFSPGQLWLPTKEPSALHLFTWRAQPSVSILNEKGDYSLAGLSAEGRLRKVDFSRDELCLFRKLSEVELASLLHSRTKVLSDPSGANCVGQKQVLLYSWEDDYKFASLRALAERKNGALWVEGDVLVHRSLTAPLCPACDEVWITPRKVLEDEFDHIVVTAHGPPEKNVFAKAEYFPESIPLIEKDWAAGKTFKGRVLLTRARSRSLVDPRLAAEIKRRGATSVTWYWAGMNAHRGFALRPKSVDGVPEVGIQEFENLRKKSVLLMDLRPRPRAPSLLLETSLRFEDLELAGRADLRGLPIVVFGENEMDLEARARVWELKKMGYQKLIWFRAGVTGYREWKRTAD